MQSGQLVQVMEGLSSCLEFIWRDTSISGLQKRCLQVLKEVFDIPSARLYQLERRGRGLQISPMLDQGWSQHAKAIDRLDEQLILQIEMLSLSQADYKNGVSVLQLGPDRFGLVVLGESSNTWCLLCWQQPVGRELQAAHSAAGQVLELFLRQLQVYFRSVARIHKTSFLLHRDDLTGLNNYRSLESSLENEIRRVHRFKTCFSVLFIDLDHFKPINDQFGHLAGSQVIKQVGEVLTDCLREVDSVFRYGGDEYVVMLLEAAGETALHAAERIRQKIAKTPFRVSDEQTVHLTASIGVACCPEHGSTKADLLRMADASMYEGKKAGRNRVLLVGDQQAAINLGLNEPVHKVQSQFVRRK